MTSASSASAKFHLPAQDLQALTLFAPSCDAIKAWLASLPKTNLGQSTRALYNAVNELNRVRLTPALRLQLLDILRPAIYAAAPGLRRHYLNQPVQLPEQPQKVARLAHVLHEQLATGYLLTAVQTLEQGKQSGFSQPAHAIATALHRSMVEHSQNLLRDYQLYRNPHPGCWATLHQLRRFAAENNALHIAIADAQCGDSTSEAAYLRALLLGGAHPNQLRQDHLAKVFQHALSWTETVTFESPDKALLVVNPDSDEAPCYREFAKIGALWLGLNTRRLAQNLADQYALAETQALSDQQLPPELLQHLAQTWGSSSNRNHTRVDVREPIEVALGMTAAHHFIAGEIDFNLLLNTQGHSKLALQDDNVFLRPKPTVTESRNSLKGINPHDVWSSPYEPKLGAMNVSLEILDVQIREQHQKVSIEKEREKFQSQKVERINVSPNGLCITWPPHSDVQLRNGEIVGIREKGQKNWSVGIVRWVQLTEAGPRLGLEFLSPSAVPYGGRVISKSGDCGEYQRVLVLPEIKQINQPTSLLAPRLPFRVGQKVSLMRNSKETRIQLTRKINSTAAFNQFEFRRLSSPKSDAESAANTESRDSSFDSLWDSL
jgi:cyclic-di-GMP-binding protein